MDGSVCGRRSAGHPAKLRTTVLISSSHAFIRAERSKKYFV